MTISSNPRIAFHAPGSETTSARNAVCQRSFHAARRLRLPPSRGETRHRPPTTQILSASVRSNSVPSKFQFPPVLLCLQIRLFLPHLPARKINPSNQRHTRTAPLRCRTFCACTRDRIVPRQARKSSHYAATHMSNGISGLHGAKRAPESNWLTAESLAPRVMQFRCWDAAMQLAF